MIAHKQTMSTTFYLMCVGNNNKPSLSLNMRHISKHSRDHQTNNKNLSPNMVYISKYHWDHHTHSQNLSLTLV